MISQGCMTGYILKDKIRNDCSRKKIEADSDEDKLSKMLRNVTRNEERLYR